MSGGGMNLYQKIVAIRKSVGSLQKDKKGDRYDYVSGNQVLTKIEDKMNELNLLLIPSTLDGDYEPYTYKTKYGEKTDLIVKGKMTYTWINGDKPEERMEVPWFYFGQMNEVSKAFGSALTYSERYFLLKAFGIPTDSDDPDAKQQDKEPCNKSNGNNLSEKQVNRFYAIARGIGSDTEKANRALEVRHGLTEPYQLTRTQYDEVCKAMESKKQAPPQRTPPTPEEVNATIANAGEDVPF